MSDPRYPIGPFTRDPAPTAESRRRWIETIRALPAALRAAVAGLDDARLDTPYRDGGWTVRQVVHHLPDSHLNAYVRFKLGLTEDHPAIRPYDEAAWAELEDGKRAPVAVSLALLEALHDRWARMLESMSDADFARTVHHPEQGRDLSLDDLLQMYAWHSRHHLAHVTGLTERMGWAAAPVPLP